MARMLKLYKSYMFVDRKDPIIDKVRTAMQDRGGFRRRLDQSCVGISERAL